LAGLGTEGTTPADLRPINPPHMDSPLQTDHSPDEGTLPSSQSESDSDLEPDDLVEKYLGLQRRLYEIKPEPFDLDRNRQKLGKHRAANVKGNLGLDANSTIARLTAKLNKIKSDILFDEDEAERRWAEIHIDLAKEFSDRKRLGIPNDNDREQPKNPAILASDASKSGNPADEEDADSIFGELFASLPYSTTNPATGASVMSALDSGGSTVKIRDFGKTTGMSPRRIFEEACKSRYSNC